MRNVGRADALAFVAALLFGSVVGAQLGEPGTEGPKTSQFVYPDVDPQIRFDHARHAMTECTTCHAGALTSRRASDELRPPMKACAGCHQSQAPKLSECGACHVGYDRTVPDVVTKEQWDAVRPAPMITPRPDAELRFDHSAHASRLGGEASCGRCHGSANELTMPTMESCNACHDGAAAPDTCTTCHPTDPQRGRIRTTRADRHERLRPDNHGVDFAKRHAALARAAGDDCMSCHVETDCASCHNASVAEPFSVHPPNFMTIHAVDARSGSGECTDCHTVQTFCTACHVRADVMTDSPHTPPPRRRFHPPGWLDSSAPGNHGVMSRRDITECATCHTENDCVSCHTGIDPHPPGFRLDCGRMLAANPAPCARCHSDPAALRALCL